MSLLTSILRGGDNNHETTSEEANAFYTDFVPEGVVGAVTNTSGVAPATGGFAVNAQGSPDMTVAVSAGVAYVTGTPTSQNSQTFRVKNTASANVTISANSSGSTKYDWIYINLSATNLNNPNTGGDNAATLTASRSSSSASDDGSPPTYGTLLAVVTVANGASSITNGNISDRRTVTGSTPGDGSITNAKLSTATGEPGGAWDTYVPVFANTTTGDGSVAGKYMRIGNTVSFHARFVIGSTSGIAGAITCTLPVASVDYTTAYSKLIGQVTISDVSSAVYSGILFWKTTTVCEPQVSVASGTYVVGAQVTATVPIASPAAGDIIDIMGCYEAAA